MTLTTPDGLFVVPPNRAAWLPAGLRHGIRMFGKVAMRSLYFRPSLAKDLPRYCCILDVSPLLRELILAVVALPRLDRRRPAHRRLLEVKVDQLSTARQLPLTLTMPSDPRAKELATQILTNSADRRRVEDLARAVHVSKRTLERLFRVDTGMSFREWRRRARIQRAMVLLSAGSSVTNAALDVGYSSTSAFIFAFRRTLGVSPMPYLRR